MSNNVTWTVSSTAPTISITSDGITSGCVGVTHSIPYHMDSDVGISASKSELNKKIHIQEVKDVNIIVPNKVVEVTFADGTKEKSVCRDPDVFSLEQAISICISKKIMGGSGAYNNAVKRGMKVYEDKLKKIETDKAEQERIAKKRAKRLAYKERRVTKRLAQEEEKKRLEKEEKIEIQKEAYIRAMEYMQNQGA